MGGEISPPGHPVGPTASGVSIRVWIVLWEKGVGGVLSLYESRVLIYHKGGCVVHMSCVDSREFLFWHEGRGKHTAERHVFEMGD